MANNTYQQSRSLTLTDKLRSLIKLSRWREHVPYTIPLVIGGAMLAVHIRGGRAGLAAFVSADCEYSGDVLCVHD